MKKKANSPEILAEYDFSGGVRGKYRQLYAEGTNFMLIDPDLMEYFPDQDSVNEALRGLAAIIKGQRTKSKGQPKKSRTQENKT